MDFYYIELISFGGAGTVACIATLYTILFSDDKSLRKAAIFNLLSFLVTSLLLHFVVKHLLPTYSYFFKLRDWIPIKGLNIIYYILFTDLLFYLYHRFVHSVPIFWTGHFSHHSGDKLHLSLIVRDNLLAHIFALPLGLLGIPLGLSPHGVFVCIRLIIFYQSFLHFSTKRDTPVLKYIFVTPYNHILHHSKVYEGFGHNFGGILNIWDRLCNTYRDNSKYLTFFGVEGLEKPDSLWAINILPLSELLVRCYSEKSLHLLFFFKKPLLKIRLNWTTFFYSFAILLALDVLVIAIKF